MSDRIECIDAFRYIVFRWVNRMLFVCYVFGCRWFFFLRWRLVSFPTQDGRSIRTMARGHVADLTSAGFQCVDHEFGCCNCLLNSLHRQSRFLLLLLLGLLRLMCLFVAIIGRIGRKCLRRLCIFQIQQSALQVKCKVGIVSLLHSYGHLLWEFRRAWMVGYGKYITSLNFSINSSNRITILSGSRVM